jgi:hypothetical protein
MSKKVIITIFVLAFIATLACYTNAGAAQTVVTDGLISFWTLDRSDMEGQIVKDIFGGNDGTIEGAPQTVAGKIGEAMEFGQDSDYIDCGNDPSLDVVDAITIEAWINPNSLMQTGGTNRNYVVGKASAFGFGVGGNNGVDNEIHFVLPGLWDSFSTASDIQAGVWTHVAVTYDKVDVKFYKNGVLISSVAHVDPIPISDQILTLGHILQWDPAPIRGSIDEVRIYNRALSENEIAQNFDSTSQLAVLGIEDKLAITWGSIKSK